MTFSNYKKHIMSEDMSLVCKTKSRHSSAMRTGVCGVVRIVITVKKTIRLYPVIRDTTVPSVQLVLEVHHFQVSQAPPTSKTWFI